MNTKYYKSMDEISKQIDRVIEEEKDIKSQLPDHPRFTMIREDLDRQIRDLRWTKKTALRLWREVKRDPKITP